MAALRGLGGVASLVAVLACAPSLAHAQTGWPGGDQWPEEGAQAQPPQGPPGQYPGGQPPAGPYPPQAPPAQPAEPPPPSLLETSTHAIDLAATFGFTTEESFDEALRAHGYSDTAGVFGGDVTSVWRLASVFWLGGRLGYRYRFWEQPGTPDVHASAFSAWLMAELRLPVGRVWEMGLTAGVGGGTVGVQMQDATEFHLAPAAVVGILMGFKIAGPVRVYTRFCYEYLEAANVNDWGHDVNLSGGSFAFGLEIRR